jgi:Glycosyl transferase family 2
MVVAQLGRSLSVELGRETGTELASPRRHIELVSVVLPCLNEEAAVGMTVTEAFRGLAKAGYRGEVVVVDNGSTDRSVELAEEAGARVVRESKKGYGAAHIAGLRAARGNVIVMADADQTYDLEHMGELLQPLSEGVDMVVGSRLQGEISAGAMPTLHRYVGTPVITRVLRVLTGTGLSDSQSGYRAFWRADALALDLKASGMEYASEQLLKAARAGLRVTDVPTDYRVRVGESKLDTISDGWRHIHMLLLLSPHLSLVIPGIVALVIGFMLSCISLVAPVGVQVGHLRWLPVFLGPLLLILGAQAAFLGSLAAHRSSLTPKQLRARLAFLDRKDAVNDLLGRFLLLATVGIVSDVVLLALWLTDRSGASLFGFAGLAQALIVIGGSGIVTLFAADYSRQAQGW